MAMEGRDAGSEEMNRDSGEEASFRGEEGVSPGKLLRGIIGF